MKKIRSNCGAVGRFYRRSCEQHFVLRLSIQMNHWSYRRITWTELTGSKTPASGEMKPSSPALCTVFSRDLSSWSTGAHSPRAARPRSRWAPSLAVAPAELGLLPGCEGSPPIAPPLLPVEAEPPSSLPPDGLSSLLEGLFLSSLPAGGFLLLLLMLPRTIPPRRTRAWFAKERAHSCSGSHVVCASKRRRHRLRTPLGSCGTLHFRRVEVAHDSL